MLFWGMWSTPSLWLLPGPLWPGVAAPDWVLSMGQIEQTVCKQMTDVKLWLLYSNTWNHLTLCKKELRFVLSTKCVYKSYMCVCVCVRIWHLTTYNCWYAIDKELHSLVHLCVVAIGKGAFKVPSTTVSIYIYIYIYIYIRVLELLNLCRRVHF